MKMLAKKKRFKRQTVTNFEEVNFDDCRNIFCFFSREQNFK